MLANIIRSRKNQPLTFEYILIRGVNDSEDQARRLVAHARRLRAKVNLIPYNQVRGLDWERPSVAVQEGFLSILEGHGVSATLRREKGHDIARRLRPAAPAKSNPISLTTAPHAILDAEINA